MFYPRILVGLNLTLLGVVSLPADAIVFHSGRRIDAWEIFLAFEASGILGSVGGIRETLRSEEAPPTRRE